MPASNCNHFHFHTCLHPSPPSLAARRCAIALRRRSLARRSPQLLALHAPAAMHAAVHPTGGGVPSWAPLAAARAAWPSADRAGARPGKSDTDLPHLRGGVRVGSRAGAPLGRPPDRTSPAANGLARRPPLARAVVAGVATLSSQLARRSPPAQHRPAPPRTRCPAPHGSGSGAVGSAAALVHLPLVPHGFAGGGGVPKA